MSIFLRAYERLKINQSNDFNCIPFPFERFSDYVPGIEKNRYYISTANSGVGKSQITDFLFVYNAFNYYLNNKDKMKLKIFYYSLEMNKEIKIIQAMSKKLFEISNGQIRQSIKDLQSIGKNRISNEVLELINTTRDYFEELSDVMTIYDSSTTPYGIFKEVDNYAKVNGEIKYKEQEFKIKNDNGTVEIKKENIFDYYIPNNKEEYVIIIIDHISLLTPQLGLSLKETIEKCSSNLLTLRNKYGYSPVVIQQQAAAQEGVENIKLSKLEPSLNGLADSKLTGRDCDICLGLFSPFRHEIATYNKYNTGLMKDNFRNLSVIKHRYGESNINVGLYFDGAVNYFAELPKELTRTDYDKIKFY